MRCWTWLLCGWLVGCSATADKVSETSDSDVIVDTDSDGVADTDVGSSGPTQYESVEAVAPFLETEFEGVEVFAYAPDPLLGVVFIFHGTGGNAGVVESTEMLAIVNEMITAGIAFVALSSEDRSARAQFDTDSARGNNVDFQRISRLRTAYIDQGVLDDDTPMFGLGFSAGGGFASYFAHAGLEEGWPIKAISVHNSTGRSSRYGAPPSLPAAWLPGEHDEVVLADDVRVRHEEHEDVAVSRWLIHDERVLEPTRFARTRFMTRVQSREVFAEAVENGFFDDRGHRLFAADAIDANIEDFVGNYDVINPKPVRAQLNVVLATHAINGEHGAAEAAFFLEHR